MHEQYIRTHGRYDPGEQRTRGYDWGQIGLDPKQTVFGKKAHGDECAWSLPAHLAFLPSRELVVRRACRPQAEGAPPRASASDPTPLV